MAAGKCKEAYCTDEWHGYGCRITEGACMFLYPDSKACAEQYGEGPDAEEAEEFEDNMTKYMCSDCGKQFILGDTATEGLPPGFPVCPYCGQSNVEWRVKVDAGDIENVGCMAIWTEGNKKEDKEE